MNGAVNVAIQMRLEVACQSMADAAVWNVERVHARSDVVHVGHGQTCVGKKR